MAVTDLDKIHADYIKKVNVGILSGNEIWKNNCVTSSYTWEAI